MRIIWDSRPIIDYRQLLITDLLITDLLITDLPTIGSYRLLITDLPITSRSLFSPICGGEEYKDGKDFETPHEHE